MNIFVYDISKLPFGALLLLIGRLEGHSNNIDAFCADVVFQWTTGGSNFDLC